MAEQIYTLTQSIIQSNILILMENLFVVVFVWE